MITFNAHYGKGIVSKLIRFFSQGEYNHTSIEVNGYVYEARAHLPSWLARFLNKFLAFKCFKEYGVIKTPVHSWDNSTVVGSKTLKIDSEQELLVEGWLNKQVGKNYDTFGVLSFVWAITKEEKGRWFCSEYAYVALMKALNIEVYNQRKSPHDFWYDLGVIIEIHGRCT